MEDDAARERKGEERQKRSDEKRQKETKIKEATKSAEDVDETGKKTNKQKTKTKRVFFFGGALAVSPAKVDRARTVGAFLDQRFVELSARSRVHHGPTMFAIVLQKQTNKQTNKPIVRRSSQFRDNQDLKNEPQPKRTDPFLFNGRVLKTKTRQRKVD